MKGSGITLALKLCHAASLKIKTKASISLVSDREILTVHLVFALASMYKCVLI